MRGYGEQAAGVGCVSAAPRVADRWRASHILRAKRALRSNVAREVRDAPTNAVRYDNASCRGFAYRAACAVRQAGGSYFAKLLTLQNRANVKDQVPQSLTEHSYYTISPIFPQTPQNGAECCEHRRLFRENQNHRCWLHFPQHGALLMNSCVCSIFTTHQIV